MQDKIDILNVSTQLKLLIFQISRSPIRSHYIKSVSHSTDPRVARGRGLGSVLAVVAAAAGGAARLAGHLAAEHGTGGGGLVLHAGVGDGAGEEPGLGARVLLQDDLGRGHPLTQLQQLLAPGDGV